MVDELTGRVRASRRGAVPGDAELWLMYSRALARMGQPREAIGSLTRAVQQVPDEGDLWVELATLQTDLGDDRAAEASLEQAERLAPRHGRALLLRAQRALAAERYDEALALCQQVREYDPERADAAWVLTAHAWEKRGRPQAARSAYERAWAIDPSNAAALLGLARFAEADGQLERAVELAGAIARGARQWPAACALLARGYVELGRGDTAVELMADLVERNPRDPVARLHLGNVLWGLSRMNEAAGCYRTAIELDPASALAHHNLAMVLKDQGDDQAAIVQLRRALELDPHLPGALFALAKVLAAAGRVSEALQTCEQLLESSPQDVDARVLAAELLSQRGECGRAVVVLRRGHALLPDDPRLARHLAWRLAVWPDSQPRDREEALALAKQVCAAKGETPGRLDTLAAAYAAVGRFEEAAAAAERALSLAESGGREQLAGQIRGRLELYRQGRPYHECPSRASQMR